jgi:hypothetical protein
MLHFGPEEVQEGILVRMEAPEDVDEEEVE